MLSERTVLDQIEIVRTGHVQVSLAHQIVRDAGLETEETISETNWRGVIDPGDRVRANELLGSQAVIAFTAWESMGIDLPE